MVMSGTGEECRMDGEQSGVWRESVVVPRVPSRVNITMFNSIVTCIVDLHSYVSIIYELQMRNACHYSKTARYMAESPRGARQLGLGPGEYF